MPLAVPGMAVSPGANNCNFTNAPALTLTDELVLGAFEPSLLSLAVTVALPAVLKVTLNVPVPEASAALAGKVALASLAMMPTVSVILFTRFQFASTALTVTLKAVPAVCGLGVPLFPLAVPGAADSPGSRIWSLVKEAALTVMEGLVLLVLVPSVASVAVTVALPAVLRLRLKVLVPETRAALAGKVAFVSLELMANV